MEMKKEKNFSKVAKKVGVVGLALAFCLVIALVIAFSVPNDQQVSTQPIEFGLPMTNAVVEKDFIYDRPQDNITLHRWEIHRAIDLASEDCNVFSIAEGTVTSVENNKLQGTVITISHADGFVSIYSSLDEAPNVKEGDKVQKGQQIGKASTSAGNEAKQHAHLHLVLMKDGLKVDPNNYLDLQNK